MEALHLFNQACEIYEKASELPAKEGEKAVQLYRQSAELYQKILDRHFIHPAIYYNLGNTYYKLNDLGRAVLNYRRAQLFLPADPDLLSNLSSAKSKILDTEPDRRPPALLQTLFFWYYETTPEFLAKASFGAYLVFSVFFILYVFLKRPFLRWMASLAGLALLILALSLAMQLYREHTTRTAVVIANSAPVRTGYEKNESERFTVHAGTELIVEEIKTIAPGDRWVKVALSKEMRGWIKADAVEFVRSGIE